MLAARRCLMIAASSFSSGGRVMRPWCPHRVHTCRSLRTQEVTCQKESTQEVTCQKESTQEVLRLKESTQEVLRLKESTQEVTCAEQCTQEVLGEQQSSVDAAYSPKQRKVILRLLNRASKSQLDCVKELRGKRAASIVRYREECGPIHHLHTLSNIQHLHSTSIPYVCDSILSLTCRTDRKLLASFLKPDITLTQLQEAESMVAVVIGLRRLAWAHIDHTLTLRDWQQRECFSSMKGQHQPDTYLQEIGAVVSEVPQADVYILEKLSLSSQKPSLFAALLHLRTVEAMLYCLLNPRLGQQRVFSMNRNTVGKHFDLMLGELRTSGVEVVQTLIHQAQVTPNPRLHIPPHLLQQYHQEVRAQGQKRNEEMCDALLLALTCYELTLFK